MSKFYVHPLAWSILLAQCSMVSVALAAETGTQVQTAQLSTLTLTAEKQDERHASSQAITQFNHDLIDVPFTKSHVSE